MTSAINSMLTQQQSLGDIKPLENAAKTVSAFLELPLTFGSGANVKLLLERVEQIKALKDQFAPYLKHEEVQKINGYLATAAALILQAVAAYPLAELGLVIGVIALGSATFVLLGGIFFIVGASLGLAGAIDGLNKANGAAIGTRGVKDADPWIADVAMKSSKLSAPAVVWALSGSAPQHMMNMALDMVNMADNAVNHITTITASVAAPN